MNFRREPGAGEAFALPGRRPGGLCGAAGEELSGEGFRLGEAALLDETAVVVIAQIDDPVVDGAGPFAVWEQPGGVGAEGSEQDGDVLVPPGDEDVVAVRLVAEGLDQRLGIVGAEGCVERQVQGVAERLQSEAGANAAGLIGSSVEGVDAQGVALKVKGIKVAGIGLRARKARRGEAAAVLWLFGMADDEHGGIVEMILRVQRQRPEKDGQEPGERAGSDAITGRRAG